MKNIKNEGAQEEESETHWYGDVTVPSTTDPSHADQERESYFSLYFVLL